MAEPAGPLYADIAANRLTEEASRRSSLHTRATAVISTSGVVISLLFSLERAANTPLSALENWFRFIIGAAILSFVSAAIIAIAALWPRSARRVDVAGLKAIVQDSWDETVVATSEGTFPPDRAIAIGQTIDLGRLERSNDLAFRLLQIALASEVLGVVLVGVVATILLANPPPSI